MLRYLPLQLVVALALAACGPEGGTELSPTAHCQRRCEILFECLELPTGPADRDREEFAECIGSCVNGLSQECQQETAFECLDCWERRSCEEVTTGACEYHCTGRCEPPSRLRRPPARPPAVK